MDLQALKELHAAVKDGTLAKYSAFKQGPDPWSAIAPHCMTASKAYNGDLNAARALHDALLPGWTYGLCFDAHNEKYAFVSDGDFETDEEYSACHAHAWLQAVLAALLFQAEVKE